MIAVRHQLTAHRRAETPKGPSATLVIAPLQKKERKLLDLYYADQIDSDTFSTEHHRLIGQIKTFQKEADDYARDQKTRDEALEKSDEVAALLVNLDLESLWNAASPTEQRTLVEDLVHSVCIYPDQITVQMAGAQPLIVGLDEVGLTQGGSSVFSGV